MVSYFKVSLFAYVKHVHMVGGSQRAHLVFFPVGRPGSFSASLIEAMHHRYPVSSVSSENGSLELLGLCIEGASRSQSRNCLGLRHCWVGTSLRLGSWPCPRDSGIWSANSGQVLHPGWAFSPEILSRQRLSQKSPLSARTRSHLADKLKS